MTTRHRPQNVENSNDAIRVALVYKNFAASKGISHIGLGVSALNTSVTLRNAGCWADVWPCNTALDITKNIDAAQSHASAVGDHPLSHVVISAPWLSATELQTMLMKYPQVDFAVISHSNVGFLMADPNGIKLLRQYIELELGHHNFSLGGNSQRFVQAWTSMYGARMIHLPNLYDLRSFNQGVQHPWHQGDTLRIGVFGATRPLKNIITAVAAAVELGAVLRSDVEIWISTGRDESAGTVDKAVLQIVDGVRHAKLKEAPWRSWPAFRQLVRDMHLLMAPSYTESFCMVVADGIAEGVPSVVSSAIDWVPPYWVSDVDDVADVARTARRLLTDVHAVRDGRAALQKHVTTGSQLWMQYLHGAA